MFDFDRAMCVYLGGAPQDSAVQIGLGPERLRAAYGKDASAIQELLDRVLDAASCSVDEQSLPSRLAARLPNLSAACRRKIESHVLYRLQH